MSEYEKIDAALYDCYAAGLAGDAQFYVEEAQEAGGPALEIGCGTGRILIPVAEAGIDITGLDRSAAMLAIARKKISALDNETQRRINLVEGDARDFSLDRQYKLVIIPFRAFLHLLTPEDQRQALNRIRERLSEDGRLVFNIFDPSLEMIAVHLGRPQPAVEKHAEFVHPQTGRRIIIWATRQYDTQRQIVREQRIFEELDDEGRMISRSHTPLTLRYIFRYEMQYLLELCGYSVEALYGDFQRGAFRPGGEQVWVARRQR